MKENIRGSISFFQATGMAGRVGIVLTRDQAQSYADLREIMQNKENVDSENKPWLLSDQELLDTLLDNDQRVIFRERFPNIFH